MTADTAELTPEPSGTEPQACPAAREKRWSALLALLTAWLLPATTARRTAHVSLSRAYAVHWLALILAALLALILAGVVMFAGKHRSGSGTIFLLYALAAIVDAPLKCGVVIGCVTLGIAVATLLLAVLVTPWGARDEPIRASFVNALRCVWLQTTHVLPAVLVVAAFMFGVTLAARRWHAAAPRGDAPPHWLTEGPQKAPFGEPRDSLVWQEYREAMRQHEKELQEAAAARRAYWENRPWYVAHQREARGYVFAAIATWFLWALLRAVGVPHLVPPAARPPMCEFCGYNLTRAAMDGRCPECGEPVERSLGPRARPGTAWQRARGLARLPALWRSSVDAIQWPSEFGRQIQLSPASPTHRWLVGPALALVFVVAAVGYILCLVAAAGRNASWVWDADAVFVDALMCGAIAVAVALSMSSVTTWLVSLYYRLRDGRNLLAAAMQIAAHLGGYVVLWACVCGFAAAAAVYVEDWYRIVYLTLRTDHKMIVFAIWFLPNLICLFGYVFLVARATAAARYANR